MSDIFVWLGVIGIGLFYYEVAAFTVLLVFAIVEEEIKDPRVIRVVRIAITLITGPAVAIAIVLCYATGLGLAFAVVAPIWTWGKISQIRKPCVAMVC